MLFVLIAIFLVVHGTAADITFNDFQASHQEKIDFSALKTCWLYGAESVDEVESGYPENGYKCKVTLGTWTSDEKQSRELCESRLPFYIIGAGPTNDGTSCTLQINLKCDASYWQIFGRCYKVIQSRMTLNEAREICKSDKKSSEPSKMAEYYSKNLALYFDQMMNIQDAWIKVPNLHDYFTNAEGDAGVYVQDGAYKYDSRMGDILMDAPESKHQVICEYTPPMTMAEMFYLAKIYSEIYPISVYPRGAIFPTSNFETVRQTKFQFRPQKKAHESDIVKFTTEDFKKKCMDLGRILSVESYPMTGIKEELDGVKSYLTHERFYLTNAFKDDGCMKEDYRQYSDDNTNIQLYTTAGKSKDYCDAHSYSFNKKDRYPTMAGMRAPLLCTLHTFSWKFADCPQETGYTGPIEFIRDDKRKFCHYVNNNKLTTRPEAIANCERIGTSLSGFDSQEEFEKVNEQTKPVYPQGVNSRNGGMVDGVRVGGVDNHYFLGGESPCQNNCDAGNGREHVASWSAGVAVNSNFLNNFNHWGFDWKISGSQTVSFRSDLIAFHVHQDGHYPHMFSVCGKSAPLVRGDMKEGKVQTAGK